METVQYFPCEAKGLILVSTTPSTPLALPNETTSLGSPSPVAVAVAEETQSQALVSVARQFPPGIPVVFNVGGYTVETVPSILGNQSYVSVSQVGDQLTSAAQSLGSLSTTEVPRRPRSTKKHSDVRYYPSARSPRAEGAKMLALIATVLEKYEPGLSKSNYFTVQDLQSDIKLRDHFVRVKNVESARKKLCNWLKAHNLVHGTNLYCSVNSRTKAMCIVNYRLSGLLQELLQPGGDMFAGMDKIAALVQASEEAKSELPQ